MNSQDMKSEYVKTFVSITLGQNPICTISAQSKCNKVPTMSKLYQVLFSNSNFHISETQPSGALSRWITMAMVKQLSFIC